MTGSPRPGYLLVMDSVEVAVIGTGPGGEHAATTLASAGLEVLAVERDLVGGVCAFWGCNPTKMAIRAGNALQEARRVDRLAGHAQVTPDWSVVAARLSEEATDAWHDRAAVERLERHGARLVRGHGRLVGPGQIEVDGQPIGVTRAIVVNTGSRPSIPPIDGLDEVDFWTNREFVTAKELPESCIVLGGGAIGAELAQVMARFGTQVEIVEMADRLLPPQEPEVGTLLAEVLRAEGVGVRTGVMAARVEPTPTGVALTLDDDTRLTAERLVVATGRSADPAGAGLDTVGVPSDAPFASTDERMRVTDGVYAVGDITGKGVYTHVSMYQAQIAVRDILGEPGPPADYRALPRVTFTDPEIGMVGLTEQEARESLDHVRVGTVEIPSTSRGWIRGVDNKGVIKVVEDAERGVLVGATAMSAEGGEVLGALSVAVHAEVPTDRLISTVFAYPTFHRGIEQALRTLS